MASFAQVLAAGEAFDAGVVVEVPETWHQGRTAYGGFSSALCLAVARQVGGAGLPPLRSGQLAMMAPVAGQVRVSAQVERQGRNAIWLSARIEGDKGLAFTASFVFMGAVTSALRLDDRPVPQGLLAAATARPVTFTPDTPAFLANHFEARYALPPEQGRRPDLCRWVRLREREGLDPMVELLLLGDALPPAVLPLLPGRVPLSTMHWQVGMLTARPVTGDGWWLLRSVGDYAESGCSSQREGMWNTDGVPVMTGIQSIALFG
ncbi:thioesterase family protein [Novosphingobium sp. BL-52-GroH]|uniref:thioesterase family protein n=1 Tax=Novosphingobium sp. BL-52-GroH TaxID=3349877 RepID=UPI00384A6041